MNHVGVEILVYVLDLADPSAYLSFARQAIDRLLRDLAISFIS